MDFSLSTGAPSFYLGRGRAMGQNMLVWTMKDRVDRGVLQKAADEVMESFPYFRVRAVLENGVYSMVPNDLPNPVWEQEEPVWPGDPAIGGHLLSVGCHGRKIYQGLFHGVCDGRGAFPASMGVVKRYCELFYGKELACPAAVLRDRDPEKETESPYDCVKLPDPPAELTPPGKLFGLPGDRIPLGEPVSMAQITLSEEEFVAWCRRSGGSPASAAALLLARAVAAVHPDAAEPVAIGLSADVRKILGCEKTVRNCISAMSLVYSDAIRALPAERQAAAFRAAMKEQLAPDVVMTKFALEKQLYEKVCAAEGIDWITELYRRSGAAPATPCVSYIGKIDPGDLAPYIENVYELFYCGLAGIFLEMLAMQGRFHMYMLSTMKTDRYLQAFLRELEKEGLSCEVYPPVTFTARPRVF